VIQNSQELEVSKPRRAAKPNLYSEIIEEIFLKGYKLGDTRVPFERGDLDKAAAERNLPLPKNLGDAIYFFKYRTSLPPKILATAPDGLHWAIYGTGRSKYEFRLEQPLDITPRPNQLVVKFPDATPEIILAHALGDEQALLAKLRYNRLVDAFLGITASSLQNHLRTAVKDIGQIEIDEIYVGLDKHGCQYVVPVQAKGGKDKHGRQQTEQDIAYCRYKFPGLVCRPVSAQFITSNKIAMFELAVQDGDIKVVSEEHYELVSSSSITAEDLALYAGRRRA